MFVNINPDPKSAIESLSALRFARQVRRKAVTCNICNVFLADVHAVSLCAYVCGCKVNACETAAKGGAKRHVSQVTDQGLSADSRSKRQRT